MPPALPKNKAEREDMWDLFNSDIDPIGFADPLKSASHLGENTETRATLSPEMTQFLRSRFGVSPETDGERYPVRPLGKGGFGGVAVWGRRDPFGNLVEETALKQSKWSPSMFLASAPHLAREALIMQQLNQKCSENIVYLKDFKCFREPEDKMTWRFYFEYCPYGDLSRLEKKYLAWGYVLILLLSSSKASC